jgi:hypothetical protein
VQKGSYALSKGMNETPCTRAGLAKVQKYNAYRGCSYVSGLLLRDGEIDHVHAKILR